MDDAHFDHLLNSLAAAAASVESRVRTVPADRWDDVIQTGDGAWTRRQLLAHMAANDLRQLVRVRVGAGMAQPGDPEAHAAELETHAWNQARVEERAGAEINTLLGEMQANRRALVALLRGLTPQQRARPMPFRGRPTPLQEMVPVLIGHLDQHAEELIAGLNAQGALRERQGPMGSGEGGVVARRGFEPLISALKGP